MKKTGLIWITLILTAAILAGCASSQVSEPVETIPATEAVPAETEVIETEAAEEDDEYEGDAATYYINEAYPEQIARYHTALSEQWNEGQYFENGMSEMVSYYYEGNPLDNVGFGFADLDGDGYWELIIGAIQNADQDPVVFEIWTRIDGEPVMLAQGASRNRYYVSYTEEDNLWTVTNEASNGAANSATYYMNLQEGVFNITQGIILDAVASPENPWFMTYDNDWDVSNDTPIDEETAMAVMESYRNRNTVLEYFPYSLYSN